MTLTSQVKTPALAANLSGTTIPSPEVKALFGSWWALAVPS